jgi:hypothetical protein
MMNYYAKFNIAECSFKKITNPAFVGVFAYEQQNTPPSLTSLLTDVKGKVRRSVTIASYVGGGVSFPSNERAERILAKEHGDLLEAYIKTIPQDRLYFFEDGKLVSLGMMMALVKIAKKCSKHVTCIRIEPKTYEGEIGLNRFKSEWEVINELADESHLFDFTSSKIARTRSVTEYSVLRWHAALRQLADTESGLDSFDYYENPHQNDWTPRSLGWRASEWFSTLLR